MTAEGDTLAYETTTGKRCLSSQYPPVTTLISVRARPVVTPRTCSLNWPMRTSAMLAYT
jgi:hypothetical protein